MRVYGKEEGVEITGGVATLADAVNFTQETSPVLYAPANIKNVDLSNSNYNAGVSSVMTPYDGTNTAFSLHGWLYLTDDNLISTFSYDWVLQFGSWSLRVNTGGAGTYGSSHGWRLDTGTGPTSTNFTGAVDDCVYDTFFHIRFSYDGTNTRVYINGVLGVTVAHTWAKATYGGLDTLFGVYSSGVSDMGVSHFEDWVLEDGSVYNGATAPVPTDRPLINPDTFLYHFGIGSLSSGDVKGIVPQQERWYKYPLVFSDFTLNGGTYDANIPVPTHVVCSAVKVVPTMQVTSATTANLVVEHGGDQLLKSYDLLIATPANDTFKVSLTHAPISTGSITVSFDAEPTAGELDLWLMLSTPGND